jgi:hypothetical protein
LNEEQPRPLFALLLERFSPKPVTEIGHILASQLRLHPSDATARVRYGGGLIAEDIPEGVADELSRQLAEAGVSTRKVEAERWGITSPGYQVVSLEFLEDALVARLQNNAQLTVPDEDVFAVDVHGLMKTEAVEEIEAETRGHGESRTERGTRLGVRPGSVEAGGRRSSHRSPLPSEVLFAQAERDQAPSLSPRGRTLLDNLDQEAKGAVELHLTVYCADPTGPLRVRRDRFDYSCLGEQRQEHSIDNFLILLEEILASYPNAWNRQPVEQFLRDLDPKKILRFKPEEAQNFSRWMLQWIRIELEERGAERSGH